MKTVSLWLLTAGVSACLSLLTLVCGLTLYVRHCEKTGRNVEPAFLRRSSLMRGVFERRDFQRFIQVVATSESKAFRTQWDFDRGTHLSLAQYDPTDMYGETRYRHKPDIRVTDVVVWSGLYKAIVTARETPEVLKALEVCEVRHRVSFETDSLGFKKTEFPIERGVPTVLFLGDSFTEGLHVSSDETFVNLFGRQMRDAGIPAVPVNGGVNGYGALEEDWTAENFASRIGAKVIIENLFLNDAGDVRAVLDGDTSKTSYPEMFRYLDRLHLFCEKSGIGLVIAVVPAKEQMGPTAAFFQRRVHTWCAENGLPFVNPLDYMRDHGQGTNYFSWDPHLNPKGHRNYEAFLFQQVLPELQRLRLPAMASGGKAVGSLTPARWEVRSGP